MAFTQLEVTIHLWKNVAIARQQICGVAVATCGLEIVMYGSGISNTLYLISSSSRDSLSLFFFFYGLVVLYICWCLIHTLHWDEESRFFQAFCVLDYYCTEPLRLLAIAYNETDLDSTLTWKSTEYVAGPTFIYGNACSTLPSLVNINRTCYIRLYLRSLVVKGAFVISTTWSLMSCLWGTVLNCWSSNECGFYKLASMMDVIVTRPAWL
jgi:hypothetical protein